MDNDAPNLELPSLDNAVDESIIAGTPTGIACPACGGALWERDEAGVRQYRCYLGHNYALANLLAEHWEALESALWNGVRTLRERAALLRRAGELNGTVQSAMVRARYQEQAVELEDQAQSIVQLIESVQHSEEL